MMRMASWMTAEDRYRHDVAFKQLVDVLEYQIQELRLTPTEIREAAVLACLHFEQKRVRTFEIDPNEPQTMIRPREPPW